MTAVIDLPDNHVHELDPHDGDFAEGNRPMTLDFVSDILPSIEKNGQQQPGISVWNTGKPGRYKVLAGHRRLICVRYLGRKFKTLIVPGPLTMVDIIKIRLTENVIRKAMSKDEIAADILRYLEATGATQEAAADEFGMSAGYLSKIIAPDRRLLPELRSLPVCRDGLRIVASLTPEQQRKIAEKIIAHGHMKREAVSTLADELKGGFKAKKTGVQRIKEAGGEAIIPASWNWEQIIDWFNSQLKKARRGSELKLPPLTFGNL